MIEQEVMGASGYKNICKKNRAYCDREGCKVLRLKSQGCEVFAKVAVDRCGAAETVAGARETLVLFRRLLGLLLLLHEGGRKGRGKGELERVR